MATAQAAIPAADRVIDRRVLVKFWVLLGRALPVRRGFALVLRRGEVRVEKRRGFV